LRQRLVIGSLLIGMVNGFVVALVIGPIAGHVLHIKLALFNMWLLSITLGIAVYISLVLNRAAAAQREQALQVQLEADQLDTALSQAELSMIQAQIEPHFLFNTLAHIKRQYRLEPAAADHMITGLIEYLERAAPAVQRADWTIGDELDLIRVYLDILAHRFGKRLRYTITAPDNLCIQRLPALTITTLVENAVRHGIAPRPEGGTVAVTVESEANSIAIHVHDNGVGLRQMSGSGLGLATVKASLRSRFGERASLVVEPNEPHGVHAAIEIPREQ
jgi:hypothetical protein